MSTEYQKKNSTSNPMLTLWSMAEASLYTWNNLNPSVGQEYERCDAFLSVRGMGLWHPSSSLKLQTSGSSRLCCGPRFRRHSPPPQEDEISRPLRAYEQSLTCKHWVALELVNSSGSKMLAVQTWDLEHPIKRACMVVHTLIPTPETGRRIPEALQTVSHSNLIGGVQAKERLSEKPRSAAPESHT